MTYSERELEFTFAKNSKKIFVLSLKENAHTWKRLKRLLSRRTLTSRMCIHILGCISAVIATVILTNVSYMSSPVGLSSVFLSVTFVRPTQAIGIFGHVSTPFGTLAI